MKKNYIFKLFLIAMLGVFSFQAQAQVNLAATANCTFTSSGGNALYGITRINNGQINPCGFQDCWVPGGSGGTTNWIVGTFTQAEDINAIRIWVAEKDRRYLHGATIQVWQGGAWVDHHTYSNPYDDVNGFANPCDYMVTFPRVNTDRIRITKWEVTASGFNQATNPDFREIEIYNLKGDDIGATEILPLFAAGNTPVIANVRNIGNNEVDSFNIEWSVNGVLQSTAKVTPPDALFYSDTLKMFKDTLLNVGSYNFIASTMYDVKVWTSLPNGIVDSLLTNDTAQFVFSAVGKPAPPVVEDQVYCGVSRPVLKGKGVPGSELNWYADALGTQFLATGDSVQLATNYYPTDTIPFYGRSAMTFKLEHTEAPMAGIWSFTGGASPQDKGVYVNIMPKYDILMDSLDIGFTAPNVGTAGPHTFEVYYKTGTHNGSETNAAAWTLGATSMATLNITPLYNNAITPVKIAAGRPVFKANTQYALYVKVKDVDQAVRTNSGAGTAQTNQTKFENSTLIIDEGAISAGNFGANGVAQGYVPEIYYYYEMFIESDSSIANIYVHPKPTGASIDGQVGSLGTLNAGVKADPDYVTNGETISYELTAPTGYLDAGFGTTWAVTSFTIETESGTQINTMDTVTSPPSSGVKGTIEFTPQLSEVDSLFKMTMVIADLGPYNCDSVIERWVYVAPRPFANFAIPATSCDGDGVFFDNLSTIESGFMTHKWSFMDASMIILDSSDAITPVYTFPTYGTYFVKLESSNAIYGYSDDTTIMVTVGEIPVIDVKVINACQGIPVQFINNTTASTSVPTFMWEFGDGGTSALTSPTHLYGTPGGYAVKFTADAAGCTSEKVINAYQFAKPVSGFDLPTGQVCSRKDITLANTTTIAIGAAGAYWNFDDGIEISTDINPKYQFTTGGSYDIKLISVSEFGCQDSITKTLSVDLAPVANFTEDQFCEKEMTQFTNASADMGTGYGIAWDFGDGTTSSLENPGHSWSELGPKTVKLRVTSANGCFEEKVKNIEVLPQPFVDFKATDGCSGVPISFENLSSTSKGELSYVWDFGGGSTSTDGAPKFAYNVTASSSRNVTLTATVPNGCPATITKAVNIEPNPVCGFTWNDTFISPMGRGVYFRATAQTGTTYNWVMGVDGPGPNMSEFFHQFSFFRPYDVKLNIQNSAGCKCESTNVVQFPPSSVKSIDELGVKVYPNPSNALINIDGNNMDVVNIYNAEGKLVYSNSKLTDTNKIDISSWAAGVYQVEVSNANGSGVVKLIKY